MDRFMWKLREMAGLVPRFHKLDWIDRATGLIVTYAPFAQMEGEPLEETEERLRQIAARELNLNIPPIKPL